MCHAIATRNLRIGRAVVTVCGIVLASWPVCRAAEPPTEPPAKPRFGIRDSEISRGSATTQLFGVRATGSRFVFVLDRSRSMSVLNGNPMRAAKAELIASLQDLSSVNQFQIIAYNEQPNVVNPFPARPPRILFGTDDNKRAAESFIRAIRPDGGTNHGEALRLALRMQPDVIFLLTDADEPRLTSSDLDQISKLNRGGILIHVVEFGTGSMAARDDFLVRLARQNSGQHVFVDISQLESSGP
jgi:hypothetical protein